MAIGFGFNWNGFDFKPTLLLEGLEESFYDDVGFLNFYDFDIRSLFDDDFCFFLCFVLFEVF